MTVDYSIELSRNAVMMALTIGAPVLIAAVVVGLIVSILQAATQVQDQTVSFVPKIVIMLLTMLYFLPWVLQQMVDYTTELFQNIPRFM
ncbi:Flagellar biosynthesis protein FliQ [hydrothermal vent metagenome]|uniref:Flagellar biosynthetic protein FliQ n=1 Tax=hydrothermal vent metagenome TaxID=652676 RepID=A0A3B1E684_9ZZZZ